MARKKSSRASTGSSSRTCTASARGARNAPPRPSRGGSSTSAYGSRSTSAYGCLFWAVLVAVILAAGFAAREPLLQAVRRVTDRKPATVEGPAPPAAVPAPVPVPAPAPVPVPAPASAAKPDAPTAGSSKTAPAATPAAKPSLRRARLYFLAAGPDGATALTPVDRDLPRSDSPLRDTIGSLLEGPQPSEKSRGISTSIPPDARLRSVTVRDATAFVDLSESFRFTAAGVEGLTAQLRQLVSTACAFPTVERVQILIEGRKVQYLGTEGVRVDEPLTPASF